MTHEKTHRTMLWAFLWGALLASVLVALTGCSGSNPAGLVYDEPNEILLYQFVQCNATYRGLGHIDVRYFEKKRPAVTADGMLGYVAGAAWPGANWAEFYHSWVLDPARLRSELAEVAAHEVAHIDGDLAEPPEYRAALEECK